MTQRSRTPRWIGLAALIPLVLVAAWFFHRSVVERVDAARGHRGGSDTQVLTGVRVSGERNLEPVEPGVGEHPFLGDVRALLPIDAETWIGTTGGLRVIRDGEERVYTARSGLLRSDITGLAASGDTIVVMHPEQGLSMVRQSRVKTLVHPDLVPTAIVTTPSGIVVGTADQGLFRLVDDVLERMPIAGEGVDGAWALDAPRITSLAYDDAAHRLWVGTFDRGLAILGAEGWFLLGTGDGLSDSFVTSIAAGRRGEMPLVLVGTQSGLTLFEEDRATIYTVEQGLPDDHVAAVSLWDDDIAVGTFGGGMGLFEGDAWRAIDASQLPSGYVQAVAYDRRGGLWIGTRDGLALRQQREWTELPRPPGPPGVRITALTAAPQGGALAPLWVGTFERGLGRFGDGNWQDYGLEEGLPSLEINALVVHRGVLWVATNSGVAFLDSGAFVPHARLDALKTRAVTTLMSDGEALWLGTASGAVRLGPEGEVSSLGVREGLINGHVYALAAAGASVWAGTLGGLTSMRADGRADALASRTVSAVPGGLSHNWVNAVLTRDEELWVGTYGGGVDRFDGSTWSKLFPGGDETLEINPGAACWIDRRPAFGTLDRGLLMLDENGTGGRLLAEELGLGCPSVSALFFDGQDAWIGTAAGLHQLPGSQLGPW